MSSSALAQFSTILNVPPDSAPDSIAAGTQINVFEGGLLPSLFDFRDTNPGGEINFFGGGTESNFYANAATVNVYGGSIGSSLQVNAGSIFNLAGGVVGFSASANEGAVLNISGGKVEFAAQANAGSVVNISGGTIGRAFSARAGSSVTFTGGYVEGDLRSDAGSEITFMGGVIGDTFHAWGALTFHGDDFAIDGKPVSGLNAAGDQVQLKLPVVSQFTGTFADGTPFSFSYLDDDDQLQNATITLLRSELPSVGPQVIHLPAAPIPLGVRSGQTLVVNEGGQVGDDFHAGAGSTVVIDGGAVGDNFEAVGARVDLVNGSIGSDFGVFTGSVLNVFGGSIGRSLRPLPGSAVNIMGGNIAGIYAHGASVTVVSGGAFGCCVWARNDTRFVIRGDDFRLNGAPLDGQEEIVSNMSLGHSPTYLLTGTLSDGTPFAFHTNDHDTFELGTLSLVRTAPPPVEPGTIIVSTSSAPRGIRAGQTLRVEQGGDLGDNFNAGSGSTLQISGGSVGDNLEAVGATIHLTDGSIGNWFDALEGTRVVMEGGTIGEQFYAAWGSEVIVLGGHVQRQLSAANGATIAIHGGRIEGLLASTGAQIEIAGGGGQIGRFPLSAGPGSFVELMGTQFSMDGATIPGLTNPGDSITLPNRNGELLQVRFRDGTTGEFILRPGSRGIEGNFALDSMLQLTLVVPEPGTFLIALTGIFWSMMRPNGRSKYASDESEYVCSAQRLRIACSHSSAGRNP